MNRTIKVIAAKLDLNTKVCFHWARHTFATRFLRHGGRLEVLQQLLGHKHIETTMIYVHVDKERKREEINLMPE
ncbi:tyrosine-type recombinase/integrase [Spirosoma gilvum]